jgi:hypothetical protein
MKKLTLKAAKQFGVVTKGNSKIHGSTFSTDPRRCNVGSKLVKVEGSTCSGCYALKLAKVYPSAQKSWSNNLDLFRLAVEMDSLLEWCEAIAHQINNISKLKIKKKVSGANMHRWFTAGDLDSIDMLRAFCKVAEMLPHIKFWLPTRERAIVSAYKASLGVIPSNMIIRISSAMVNSQPIDSDNTSTVHKKNNPVIGFNCPAQKQKGNCGDCSACWNTEVKNISYELH